MRSFDSIYANLMHVLSEGNRVEEISNSFCKCPSDEIKIQKVFAVLQEENIFPQPIQRRNKSKEESIRIRKVGNVAFKQKKFSAALKLYTQCVAIAPNYSAELALAYANRSAVLFSLKSDKLCVIDINRAILCNYPDNLKYKLYERKAKCFQRNSCSAPCKKILLSAIEYLKKSSLKEESKKSLEESYRSNLEQCIQNTINNTSESIEEENGFWSSNNGDALDPILCENNVTLPKIFSLPNPVIPCASQAIKMEYSNEEGRYLCATEDIHPGDVLVVEKPYASILLPDLYSSHCYECYKRNDALVPCLQCSLVMYCSEKCRIRNWEKCHRTECVILPSLLDLEFNKMELLALRILLIATKHGAEISLLHEQVKAFSLKKPGTMKGLNSNGQYISSDYCSMHHLETNTHRRSLADLFRRSTVACVFIYFLRNTDFFKESVVENLVEKTEKVLIVDEFTEKSELSESELFCGALLMKYLQFLPCNAHEVSEMVFTKCTDSRMVYDSLEIGAVAYPVLSLINHSCDPNVVRHSYDGDTVVLSAIQVISAGQQLYDNYGYHHALHTREERQKHLLDQYYFRCQCIACIQDWPRYAELPSTNPVYLTTDNELIEKVAASSETFKGILEKVFQMETKGHLDFLYKHLAFLQRTIQRPWKEYSVCQETIKQCLSMESNHCVLESPD